MKTNARKWHARIVHFPDVQFEGYITEHKECNDFCSYTRWFLWKLLVVIPLVCMLVGGYFGMVTGQLAAMVSTGTFNINDAEFAFSFLFFLSFPLILYAGCALYVMYDKHRDVKRKEQRLLEGSPDYVAPEPNFFVVWYSKFKDKFCPQITYGEK